MRRPTRQENLMRIHSLFDVRYPWEQMNARWRRWSLCALLALTMVEPAYVAYGGRPLLESGFANLDTLWRIMLGLACLALALSGRARESQYSIIGPFLPFFAWATLCWVYSGCHIPGFKSLGSSLIGFLFAIGVAKTLSSDRDVKLVFRSLLAGVFLAVIGAFVLYWFGLQPIPGAIVAEYRGIDYTESRFLGIGYAGNVATGVIPLFAVIILQSLSRPQVSKFLLIAFLLGIQSLTSMRNCVFTSIVVVILAGGASLFSTLGRGCIPARTTGWLKGLSPRGIGIVVLILAISFSLIPFIPQFVKKTETIGTSGRLEYWPLYMRLAAENPIFGLGAHGDTEFALTEGWDHIATPHNDYIMLAVCYGLPGLLLWMYGLVTVTVRVYRCSPRFRNHAICRSASLLTLVGLAVMMLVANRIRSPATMIQFLAMPALCLAVSAQRRK